MKFKHYVITRFNLRTDRSDKSGRKVNNPDWLKHRCDLFEKYCLPSFDNQTNKNFTWCIYFDPETPEEILDRYRKYDFIEIILPGDNDPGLGPNKVLSYLRQLTKDEDIETIITSRVDNDDSISKYYIEAVQKVAESVPVNEKKVINFNYGLDYVISGDYFQAIGKGDFYTNPFISFVEPYNDNQYLTVNDRQHGHMAQYPVQYIHTDPMWMRVIHDRNLLNSEKDFGRNLTKISKEEVIKCGFDFL